jgi:hypothetical protein
MSGTWETWVYFARSTALDYEFINTILHEFIQEGCSFLNPNFNLEKGFCIAANGIDTFDTDNLHQAILWLLAQKGGALQLWYPLFANQYFDFSISFETKPLDQQTHVYRATLFLDYNYLRQWEGEHVKRLYLLIFRWSYLLAIGTNAMVGYGDISLHGTHTIGVLHANLAIPQIFQWKWWNYYRNDYVQRLGEAILMTHGAWATLQSSKGLTVITGSPDAKTVSPNEEDFILLRTS